MTLDIDDTAPSNFTKLPKPKPKAVNLNVKPNFDSKLSSLKSFERLRQNSLFRQIVTHGKRLNAEVSLSRKEVQGIKPLASVDFLLPKKDHEASAIQRPTPFFKPETGQLAKSHQEKVSRKSTDFLASADFTRQTLMNTGSRLSTINSKAVFQKIRLAPPQSATKKETPPSQSSQISSIIFDPEKATNKRQLMTVSFLKEKLGSEKFETVRKMYIERQCSLKEIEDLLTNSQRCLVKLFPVAFDFSTPTTQESRMSGRCSFK